jgi:SulP family sulfate permease
MTETNPVQNPGRISALLPNITAGLVFGVTEVILAISLASLMFSGPLEAYLPRGIAIMLLTSILHMVVVSIFSRMQGALSGIQEGIGVLMAVSIASLAGAIGAVPELLPSVITLIVLTTLAVGCFMLLVGYFRLGGLMRYIPYPVIGGFLAGTGWLLVQGSFGVTADYALTLDNLPNLLQPGQLILWLPGVIFGLVLYVAVRRSNHFLVMPTILLGGLVLFYLVLFLTGLSPQAATERGLLLGTMGGNAVWQPFPLVELAQADWGAVLKQAGNMGIVVILSTISLLLNISGLELELHKDVDLNQELRVAGFANLLAALGGGMVGFHDLGYTALAHHIQGRGRIAGLVTALFCLVILVVGSSLLAYVPKALLAGLLLFLGLKFLHEWLIEGYWKLGRVDYGVVLLILFIIAASDFLIGVSVGLILMVVIFVVNYSRINIFHHVLSGAETASRVERNAYHQRELVKLGRQVYILELQGFIFFGTANTVLEQIRTRLNDADEKRLVFLILDFRRVTGLDSSALFSLTKAKHLAEAHDFTLIFTNMMETMQEELSRSGLTADKQLIFFPDLDHGLEWVEEAMLEKGRITKMHFSTHLGAQLADLGFQAENTPKLLDYLERMKLMEGDYLIRQGEPFSDLYFIEVGQVSVYLELENDKRVRVQTPSMGTIVGELGFYLDVPRSASVIADMNTIAYRLTRKAMEDMKVKDPELAIAFNDMMLRVIAERLVTTNRELAALNR